MLSWDRLRNIWNILTEPQSTDIDKARQEYLTKVIVLIMLAMPLGIILIFALGWVLQILPGDSVFVALGMTMIFGIATWLMHHGHWRLAGFFPPITVFLTAVYGNWIGGAGSPAMLFYALAIILACILQGGAWQWAILGSSIIAYVGIGSSQMAGYIVQLRTPETAFPNRVVIVIGVYTGLAFLLWFLSRQFQIALDQARTNADRLLLTNQQLEQQIAERKKIEAALRESEQKYKLLVETTGTGYVIMDGQGRVIDANQEYVRLTGHQQLAEILGHHVLEWTASYDRAHNEQAITQTTERGFIRNLEIDYVTPAGLITHLEINATVLHTPTFFGIQSLCRDISERKIAEKALLAKTAELDRYFDSSLDLLCIADTDGFFRRLNPEWEKVLGYTIAELEGRTFLDLVHPDDVPATIGAISQLSDQEQVLGFVNRYRRKDGSYRWIEWRAYPEGRNIYAVARDITERKRTEDALRASEARFRAVIDNSFEAFVFTDQKGKITYASPSIERIIGYTPEERAGRSMFDLMHPDDRAEVQRRTATLIQTPRSVISAQYRTQHKDGSWHWVEVFAQNLLDDPNIQAIVISGHDVTERRQAEDILRMFQYTVDQATEAVYWINREAKFEYVNEQACRSTGYTLEEFMDLSLWDLDPIYPREKWNANWGPGSHQKGNAQHVESLHRRKDGTVFPVELSSNRLWMGDREIHVSVVRDITQRKQVEAEREKLIQELETKNAELERFTYTVSHDLKSPLVTIQGFLGFLKQELATGNNEQAQRDIARIVNAAEKMQQLLGELLELSRIGRLINPPQDIAFGELAQEALNTLAGRIAERHVEIRIASALPVVHVDRTRLREALENLLDNAIKFTSKQPSPTIEIGARRDESKVIFYVRDNGIGIESRYLDKVFGLFEKLDSTSAGTGIGLAIVKRIIEVHGGRIWVESEGLGKGSTFCFTIPPCPGKEASPNSQEVRQ